MTLQDPFRDTNVARTEVEDYIRCRLHGFYFDPRDSILPTKHEDEGLFQHLSLKTSKGSSTKHVSSFIWRALFHCVTAWDVLESKGSATFWTRVSCELAAGSIQVTPMILRDLVTVLIKARHRYIIRQRGIYPDFNLQDDISGSSDSPAQRILERVEALEDPVSFSGDVFRIPLCSSREEADLRRRLTTFGPVKQISRKSFQLHTSAPQKLYPISELARGPKTSNLLGLFDQMVRPSFPERIAKATKDPECTPGKRRPIQTPKSAPECRADGGRKRRSQCSPGSPLQKKPCVSRRRDPARQNVTVEGASAASQTAASQTTAYAGAKTGPGLQRPPTISTQRLQ
ncbi:uncharacterized protein UV8b_03602 [Ustilaginoidea virens]|uniref:Uncharacterized protein n=1 Tax=Ustilaginoidea virens TaxID=1159556 RepID=A0A8E5HPT2_USTVR|nr:uncharacterized protein UV8b_03602 [Ustilaginoidea virens]QUC19361.1 hypothetical protein UV8b_03602 [Ustilaginoidea virens]